MACADCNFYMFYACDNLKVFPLPLDLDSAYLVITEAMEAGNSRGTLVSNFSGMKQVIVEYPLSKPLLEKFFSNIPPEIWV